MKRSSTLLKRFIAVILGTALVMTLAYAQNFLGSPPPPAPINTSTSNIPPSRVLSTDEFNKVATQTNQQNSSTLSKEVAQKMPKLSPPLTPPGGIKGGPQVPPNSPQSPSPNLPNQPTTQPVAPPPNYSSSSTDVSPPPANVVTPGVGQQQPQPAPINQPYTGFGAGNTDNKPDSNKNNNPGWNIRY